MPPHVVTQNCHNTRSLKEKSERKIIITSDKFIRHTKEKCTQNESKIRVWHVCVVCVCSFIKLGSKNWGRIEDRTHRKSCKYMSLPLPINNQLEMCDKQHANICKHKQQRQNTNTQTHKQQQKQNQSKKIANKKTGRRRIKSTCVTETEC